MKRLLIAVMILALMFSAVACGSSDGSDATTTAPTETKELNLPTANAGELKPGVYTATSSYATEGMNMTWNFVLTLKADGSFTLSNDAAEDKGTGTYALTDSCYTMTYSDNRTCTFVVNADGTLTMTSDFPYGIAQIQLALVGNIVFNYAGEVPAETAAPEPREPESGAAFTVSAGNYAAEYKKESAMAGSLTYAYTAVLGADKSFSYAVSFNMGGKAMEGSSAKGTYAIDGSRFIFTDSEGKVTEGKITANDTIVISLKASTMASEPYEVTFKPASFTLEAGNYKASYTKESAMAGKVVYEYTASIGADKTFSYAVTFNMGGQAMEGSSAKGTYTLDGSKFVFTDSEGKAVEGKLTADNTLVISLSASAMAKEPYEVTFVPAK